MARSLPGLAGLLVLFLSGAAVAAVTASCRPRAGDRVDQSAARIDPPDHLVLRVNDVGATTYTEDVGVNQYLFYNVCDSMALGTRIEWWKNDGTSFHQWTSGVNFRPVANCVFRPEIRYDWSPATNFSQTTFGIDFVTTF